MPKFKVTFKESYMPREVTRVCDVPTRDDVIRIYNLEDDSIEWYEIDEI